MAALYRMGFSEPWDQDGDLLIEIDHDEIVTSWPIFGVIEDSDFDASVVGRRAEIRAYILPDTRLDHSPSVSIAVEAEDTASGWRGLGIGTLHKIKGHPVRRRGTLDRSSATRQVSF